MASNGDGVSNGAINGARAAYELHTTDLQENSSAVKPIPNPGNRPHHASTREPLTSIASNRKGARDASSASYNRVEELGKNNGGMSRSGSETDSLLDLYRRDKSTSNVDLNGADPDIPENMYRPDEDDPDGWIHRDKLAKIESEELQAAGINLANARRNISKSGRRMASRDGTPGDGYGYKSTHDEKRQRVSSPVAEEDEVDKQSWDLRNPEEIAAEPSAPATPSYITPVLRKTGSKIPILTSSPLPVPQDRVERDTPLPRKRTMSGSISPDEAYKARPRTASAGSAALLDAFEPTSITPGSGIRSASKTSSPTKSKAPNTLSSPTSTSVAARKVTPTVRKGSVTSKIGIAPTAAGSPSQRPGTRSGEIDRPRTAVNRPEGDPPWLATMYKPDPRLPPDQQIIPTHARRQQQAQWNEEGAIPNTYDREFSPLSVTSAKELPRQPSPTLTPPEKTHDSNAWPLKPMPSVPSTNTGRPGTSGSITGGYSTMPKVTSPPLGMSSPRMSSAQSPRVSTNPNPPARMQEQKARDVEAAEGDKERGCGCCIVM